MIKYTYWKDNQQWSGHGLEEWAVLEVGNPVFFLQASPEIAEGNQLPLSFSYFSPKSLKAQQAHTQSDFYTKISDHLTS